MNTIMIENFKKEISELSNTELLKLYKDLGKQIKGLIENLAKYESEDNYSQLSQTITVKYCQDIVFDKLIGGVI